MGKLRLATPPPEKIYPWDTEAKKTFESLINPAHSLHRVQKLADLEGPDASFDCIASHNFIATLPDHLYRLALSELSRMLKPQGHLLISTPLDLYSTNALQLFEALVATEFIPLKKTLRKDSLSIRFRRLLKGRHHQLLTRFSRTPTHVILLGQKNNDQL